MPEILHRILNLTLELADDNRGWRQTSRQTDSAGDRRTLVWHSPLPRMSALAINHPQTAPTTPPCLSGTFEQQEQQGHDGAWS
mmetsp:Transcript_19513/g.45396  ORF Transcript_19513/g.45396 Transcript_19513/m.45396 type:complete len:83 (+) Transcript_19513:427-675(+)